MAYIYWIDYFFPFLSVSGQRFKKRISCIQGPCACTSPEEGCWDICS